MHTFYKFQPLILSLNSMHSNSPEVFTASTTQPSEYHFELVYKCVRCQNVLSLLSYEFMMSFVPSFFPAITHILRSVSISFYQSLYHPLLSPLFGILVKFHCCSNFWVVFHFLGVCITTLVVFPNCRMNFLKLFYDDS